MPDLPPIGTMVLYNHRVGFVSAYWPDTNSSKNWQKAFPRTQETLEADFSVPSPIYIHIMHKDYDCVDNEILANPRDMTILPNAGEAFCSRCHAIEAIEDLSRDDLCPTCYDDMHSSNKGA
jgi:hypothetical protein